ncbi:DgyrCDS11629 [Dimorphilus gyrociliatus]|uniref:Superoxide dismutase copper chaperone n=1 Tax=Dimorphilus gyrociliatus TaxID=2664684 RepID=A0A7I8W5T3_9ANNE|nr:DgyrCDS11629 [Dimorphilus gyrociliatus]
MAKATMEFVVEMKCESCETSIRNALSKLDNIDILSVDLKYQRLVVSSSLPSTKVLQTIESTGKRAVLQGLGDKKINSAAVCMMSNANSKGVTRLVQMENESCIIEGTIDGLRPKTMHKLFVHELGDLSEGCQSCGDIFQKNQKSFYPVVEAESSNNGRLEFRVEKDKFPIYSLIGRSLVLHDSAKNRQVCGIIARSSGLFENTKRICACDGVTVWDERDVPLAGPERSQCPNGNCKK